MANYQTERRSGDAMEGYQFFETAPAPAVVIVQSVEEANRA